MVEESEEERQQPDDADELPEDICWEELHECEDAEVEFEVCQENFEDCYIEEMCWVYEYELCPEQGRGQACDDEGDRCFADVEPYLEEICALRFEGCMEEGELFEYCETVFDECAYPLGW